MSSYWWKNEFFFSELSLLKGLERLNGSLTEIFQNAYRHFRAYRLQRISINPSLTVNQINDSNKRYDNFDTSSVKWTVFHTWYNLCSNTCRNKKNVAADSRKKSTWICQCYSLLSWGNAFISIGRWSAFQKKISLRDTKKFIIYESWGFFKLYLLKIPFLEAQQNLKYSISSHTSTFIFDYPTIWKSKVTKSRVDTVWSQSTSLNIVLLL